MSKLNLYETSWTDIVFENRNKEYGAYHLRQENAKMSLTALFVGTLLLASFIGAPAIYNYLNPGHAITAEPTIEDPLVVTKYEPYVPPQNKVDEEPMPAIEKPITENINVNTQLINPEIVQAEQATTEKIATNTELRENTSSNTGSVGGTGVGTEPSSGTGTGTSAPGIIDNAVVSTAILDKMPEFPGGINKFYSYVGNNFEKPELDSETAIRVSVSFVIEKDGSMTDIKVLKDPGYGLGREAIRVLKSLKTKWAPGILDGKPVRTAYNLPITIQSN